MRAHKVPFDIERVGLTLEQAQTFNLLVNPERPNQYQWEALSDEQAKTLILGALAKYLHKIPESHIKQEAAIKQILKDEWGD